MCSLLTLISTNKTYHHVITEILLKVALNIINQAIISFRPVILAKFDAPEYTVFIIWFHFAQWHLTYIWFIDLIDNATFSNISAISWQPVLLVEEAGVPGENHRTWSSNWKPISLAVASRVHIFCNLQSRIFDLAMCWHRVYLMTCITELVIQT